MDNHDIDAVAQSIVQACLASDDPVQTLHAALNLLQANGEWSETEIRQLSDLMLETVKQFAQVHSLRRGAIAAM